MIIDSEIFSNFPVFQNTRRSLVSCVWEASLDSCCKAGFPTGVANMGVGLGMLCNVDDMIN